MAEAAAPAPAAAPAAPAAGGTKKLNWVLTLVLSILVGSLGVDRFMMGEKIRSSRNQSVRSASGF